MADKMMRIAGRGEDGTAKAIQTDNKGNLHTIFKNAVVVEELESGLIINPGESEWLGNFRGYEVKGNRISVCLVSDKTVPLRLRYMHRTLYSDTPLESIQTAIKITSDRIVYEFQPLGGKIAWNLMNEGNEPITVQAELVQFI